jgi:TOMM system kinase/cyclase fusion protein
LALLSDQPFIPEYRLLHLLGEGGGGSVFKAQQISTGQTVALKLLRATDVRQGRMVARFERETRLCAQLHHPHIVTLLDKGQAANRQLFAVFEYVPGETLKDLLIRKGALPALEAGDLMGQVLDALACAHAQGIAHRDLKPQNIMISATGTRRHVKVLDFGIAAFIPERQKADYRNLTMTSEMMCSPSYSAPEHLRGEPPTVKIDLYAWGLLFIECLTGRPAIEGITLADIFHQQLSSGEVPLPPALVGHPLADLLRRALRKNPQERAESAAALYLDFQKINLANIVGDLTAHLNRAPGQTTQAMASAITQEYSPGQFGLAYQQQQITVLSCTLNVVTLLGADTELEVLEALQRDQLSSCSDNALRYGGHLAGSLGNSLMFYFGYPHIAEDDARRCARTALALSSQVRRRNALLAAQGFRLDIQIGIHTGMVRILPGYLPVGITPNTALQLERLAAPASVLVSATSRKILNQHLEFGDDGQDIEKNDGERLTYFEMLGEHKAEAAFLLRSGHVAHGMIGRESELAQLHQAWTLAKNGQGQARLLQGEAGIGKSRLAYEFCLAVRQAGAVGCEVRCLPEYQNNALHPMLSMLKSHLHLHQETAPQEAVLRLQNALQQVGATLEWVLPILCSWLALPIPADYPPLQFSPERQKNLLLDALQRLILQFGHGQPLLLLIEDLHWIDQTSLELLARIIEQAPHQSVLLLLSTRPGFRCSWPTVRTLTLARLPEAVAGQLVTTLIGGKPIDPAALHRLCERTDGVPLFVEELTRMLLDNQLLVEQCGVYQLDARFETSDIPITLRDLLSARLARLGAAKDTAQLAAAIGREFDYALLAEVALSDQGTLQTDLEQLIAADLIYRQRRVQGDSYIFRHALIRDAAYDAMPKIIREQTHARIARQMEDAPEADIKRNLAQLARHFALALVYDRAVGYGTRAAQTFLERALAEDAIKLGEMVQGWIGKLPQPEQRPLEIDISRVLTNALMSKFGWADERVKQQTEHALRLVDGSNDAQQALPTLWAMAFYHHVAGHRSTVRTLTAQLFGLAEQSNDQGLLVACNTMHGIALWIDGRHQPAVLALQQVLHDYDPAQHAHHGYVLGLDSRVWAMAGLGSINWFMQLDDAASFDQARAAVAYARELNHIPSLGVALMYQAFNYQYADDRENALAVSGELLALARQYGLPAVEAYAAIVHAWCTLNLALADQVLSGLRQLGCILGLTCIGAMPAEIEARAGNYASAFERIEACLALSEQTGENYFNPELLLRRALYRSHTDMADPQQSRADLLQAMRLAQASGMERCVQHASAQLAFYL